MDRLAHLRQVRAQLHRQRLSLPRREYVAQSRAVLYEINSEIARRARVEPERVEQLLGPAPEHRLPCPVCGKSPPPGQVWRDYSEHLDKCLTRKG